MNTKLKPQIDTDFRVGLCSYEQFEKTKPISRIFMPQRAQPGLRPEPKLAVAISQVPLLFVLILLVEDGAVHLDKSRRVKKTKASTLNIIV